MRHRLVLPLLAFALGAADPPPPAGSAPPPDAPAPRRGIRVFISPMGEPFRPDASGEEGLARWFAGADANHDGALDVAEMEADASRFFAFLDANHDGEIDPTEIERYETEIAPEIHQIGMTGGGGFRGRRGGGHGGGHGGGRGGHGGMGGGMGGGMRGGGGPGGMGFGGRPGGGDRGRGGYAGPAIALLGLPEPVTAADTNFNRGVSLAEFRQAAGQRFLLLDANHDGRIRRDELVPYRAQRAPTPAADQGKEMD